MKFHWDVPGRSIINGAEIVHGPLLLVAACCA